MPTCGRWIAQSRACVIVRGGVWVGSYGDVMRGLTILKFAFVEREVGHECDGGVWWF